LSSRILKAANVFIDQDNTVHIKAELQLPAANTSELAEELAEESPEDIAKSIIKNLS